MKSNRLNKIFNNVKTPDLSKDYEKVWKRYERKKSDVEIQFEEDLKKLNYRQGLFFDLIDKGDRNIFLTSGAGCGKTYLLKFAVNYLQNIKRKQVIVCASSACAAQLIGGTTIHRAFGLGLECITPNGKPVVHATKKIVSADYIFIDEISLCRCDVFTSVALSIKKANKKREKEGKKPIVLCVVGDMFQISPVLTKEDKELLDEVYGFDVKSGYAFMSPEWNKMNFINFELDEVMRQKGDAEFINNLNKVRKGYSKGYMYFNQNTAEEEDKNAITILPYNKQVDEYNNKKLEEIDRKLYSFPARLEYSTTKEMVEETSYNYMLNVKVGARIMITINGCQSGNFYEFALPYNEDAIDIFRNGSTGYIREIELNKENPEKDRILIETDEGKFVYMYRKRYEIYDYEVSPSGKLKKKIIGSYYQFPIRVCYAITLHRSQGATYTSKVTLNPQNFAPGMAYVGLSRVSDIRNLYLTQYIRDTDIICNPDVLEFYDSIKFDNY